MNTIHLIDNRNFLRKILDNFQLWKYRIFHNHKECIFEESLLANYQKSNCLDLITDYHKEIEDISDILKNIEQRICKNCLKRFSCDCNKNPEDSLYWCFNCKRITIFNQKQTGEDSYNVTCLRCKNIENY
ncbi:MAG: hypothetical protein HeimC3_44370 [Candidatus Heimdallarchaeota archaeon LC_3]|nr:MAG: hypothetical protein HeimC3_44370 [Candidatus Heimdallarchaeota archaeon LC_3]